MYCALHLDMHTCAEWPRTLKPLKISSPGVSPLSSPSLECSMCVNTQATIQWWNCSSGHSCANGQKEAKQILCTYVRNIEYI